ncbi:MAG TPA: ParB N-terminal domain-containing protein, partial [Solirubrobacteraceae bacterium]|nr:ParB N-terminal domain-containing protein [Solirubrobacteraceae bacterium]
MLERIPLDEIELAPNHRRNISRDGIQRLAKTLATTGQLIPCIGNRPKPDRVTVLLYDGQRRLLAAKASHELAGTDGFEGLAPVRTLIVLLLDHAPTPDEIRRIQAQANQREELTLVDQQQQFADCWHARAGLSDDDRVLAVCADLGISPKRAHNLRRQLTLPEPIRERVAERPNGHQLSVTMANRLADMHEIAPNLTHAVAQRITSTDLHDSALRDLGAFVHRTIVEDEHTYAVRIDDGAMLDAAEQIERARPHLTKIAREQLAQILSCEPDKLDRELDTLTARAKTKALKIKITPETRDRARVGRFAYVHTRGHDFADGIWVVNPPFMIDLVREHVAEHQDDQPAREEAFFAGAALEDDELRTAGQEDRERRTAQRLRRAEATNSNLGLGHDLRAGLIDPTPGQLHA